MKKNIEKEDKVLDVMKHIQFILCPVCNNKTRVQMRPDTELKNFPLFCPKCKQESIINVKKLIVNVISTQK